MFSDLLSCTLFFNIPEDDTPMVRRAAAGKLGEFATAIHEKEKSKTDHALKASLKFRLNTLNHGCTLGHFICLHLRITLFELFEILGFLATSLINVR